MAIGSAAKERPKKRGGVLNMLGPGFRFHPTDEELVRYYLRRKVCGKDFRIDAISDVDIYKKEPWDLPSLSKLNSRDLEWYFFSMLDKKYDNGGKTNRATEKGYWKTTGKDRAVYHRSHIVGMKKTLVYHIGRAPKGQRTNWVMHEYRLEDLELDKAGIAQDSFVLCRVFQKSGTGPQNGEQYGAPFVEEEWEDDDFEIRPQVEAAGEVDYGEGAYLDGDDLKQILGPEVQAGATSQLNLQSSDGSGGDEEKAVDSFSYTHQQLAREGEQYDENNQLDGRSLHYTIAPYDSDVKQVKHEYIGEPSRSAHDDDILYLLDEPVMDSYADLQFNSEQYFDSQEFTDTIETTGDPSAFDMVDDYLSFVNPSDNLQQDLAFDSSLALGEETLDPAQALLPRKDPHGGTSQGTTSTRRCLTDDAPSPSNKNLDSSTDFESPQFFDKQTSQMMGSIPSPDKFASKDTMKRLSSLSMPSSSVHVTAGMIRIRSFNADGNGKLEPTERPWNVKIVISFGYSLLRDDDCTIAIQGKAISSSSIPSGGCFCFLFWVLLLSISLKAKAFVVAQ